MHDPIFSPSFGNRPTQMVGREGLVRQLLGGLESRPGSRERVAVVLGQRGSGKTVLLWEIADHARKKGFVVATPTVAAEGMLERIVEKIQDDGERYVKDRKTHLTGGSVGALGFTAGLQFSKDVQESKSFQYKLTHLSRKLTEQGRGTLILIDELQANSPEVRQLIIAYQELVGEGCNVALLMAGLPGAVSATLNDRVLTFLNRSRKMTLPPLSTSDVDAFFARSFDQLGIRISTDNRRRAAEATQGSPYLLQLIGHNVVLYAGEDGVVSEDVLEDALKFAQEDFESDVCTTTMASLSEQDENFLRAMAKDPEESRMTDIAQRMSVTPDYAQKYRRRLIDAGVIEAPGRGRVRFAVPFLAHYLRSDE